MPGRGSYGPGGKWIYGRAARLRAKNPDMDESTSFAIATQQAHKVKKSPKGFRTPEGVREAKRKMTNPIKEYRKTAALAGFFDEMDKIAKIPNSLKFLLGFILGREVWNKSDEKEKYKHAAMGMDLRMNGPGNVKRPPFATEGSKGLAMKQFNQSRKIGTTAAVKAPTPAPRAASTML